MNSIDFNNEIQVIDLKNTKVEDKKNTKVEDLKKNSNEIIENKKVMMEKHFRFKKSDGETRSSS